MYSAVRFSIKFVCVYLEWYVSFSLFLCFGCVLHGCFYLEIKEFGGFVIVRGEWFIIS